MAANYIHVSPFLEAGHNIPVVDVRSPGEYAHAHIPGAWNLPLFNDEERAKIGTAYKQESREQAIKIGLDTFGPKMREMVEAMEHHCKDYPTKKILLHCWRGGMRSEAVAWLLSFVGFEVQILEGGYKAYRNWVIDHWNHKLNYRVLAGNTGSGKTEVLHALQGANAAVLDLEGLALHRGSAFGAIPNCPQPNQEMFENLLAQHINLLQHQYPQKTIWVEDESQRIGNLNLPHEFYKTLSSMPKVYIELPFEARLDRVVAEYGVLKTEILINNIVRIKKRLGPLETKTAITHLIEGNTGACFRILLQYYDKHYYPSGKEHLFSLDCTGKTSQEIATLLNERYPHE